MKSNDCYGFAGAVALLSFCTTDSNWLTIRPRRRDLKISNSDSKYQRCSAAPNLKRSKSAGPIAGSLKSSRIAFALYSLSARVYVQLRNYQGGRKQEAHPHSLAIELGSSCSEAGTANESRRNFLSSGRNARVIFSAGRNTFSPAPSLQFALCPHTFCPFVHEFRA